MPAAFALTAVTKTFGQLTAIDRLDLSVPAGALCGFIGPNGAGKTTTIRLLLSILFPDSGQVEVLGQASALDAKDRIGYLPEERGVYKSMKVGDYLRFIARLKGVPEPAIAARIQTLLERVQLPEVRRRRCEDLSKGMRQKVQFAAAIINAPELLILDEPFSGLDPVNLRLLRELVLEEHRRGATVLFSTHDMRQAEEICEHVVMLHQGRKVLDDPVAAILGQYDAGTLVVEPLNPGTGRDVLERVGGVSRIFERPDGFELDLTSGADQEALMRDIVGLLPVARIELKRARLEDVFVRLVAGASVNAAAELIGARDTAASHG